MGKLIKYEFRKTMFSKMILLIITAIAEIAFLLGVFLKWEKGLAIGIFGLMMCASVGIIYIGIESISTFQKDLNTKQSYMLFLTPKSSFQILGAKVIENGIALLLAGIFYAVLAAIDISAAILYLGGLKELLELLHELAINIQMNINITPQDALMFFFTLLTFWLLVIQTGYLAIVLSATVLAGKRFSGFVSFVLFILINWLVNYPVNLIPDMANRYVEFTLMIGLTLLIVAAMYALTAWIMEKKLSV